MSQFKLADYLTRIGFQGMARADLATVTSLMRAQLQAVPFENLDIQAGKMISIDPDVIAEKLITRRRGGYCYEVNGLFAMALHALQIPYFFIAARPLTHHNVKKPKTHMAVVVEIDGDQWLCDCGYGGYGLRAPMNLGLLDTEVSQDGELFILSRVNDSEIILKSHVQDVWEAQYTFDLAPQDWVDFEPANYYSSTHHDSLFVRKLLVVLCTAGGRKILFGHTLKLIENGQQQKLHLTPENRVALLREHFGLSE